MPARRHIREFVRVETTMPRECVGADVVVQPYDDVLVLRHRVRNRIAASAPGDERGPRVEISIATLPRERGLYYARQPIGIGYVGRAEIPLAERVRKSLADNLPGEVEWVLTATSRTALEASVAEVFHAEAILIERTHARWHLMNEKREPVQRLPHGSHDHAERLAAALEHAIAHDLPPLANPVTRHAYFTRDLHRRAGIVVDRDLGAALEMAVAGRVWDGADLRDSYGRDVMGRADSGPELRFPVGERLAIGVFAPLGWRHSKFSSRPRTGWLQSIARKRELRAAARATQAAVLVVGAGRGRRSGAA